MPSLLPLLVILVAARPPVPDPKATALVDSAIARMGGAEALARITRARFEMMTQWQRVSFNDHPYPDMPSYERHSDLRDYSIPAWRNTRQFQNGTGNQEVTDIVNDDVAIRRSGGRWAALNIAYLDERREVFAFTPERVLLLARAAADLARGADTTIAGRRHARLTATVDRYPAELFLRRDDGLLAMARYRAAQPNDMGLSPWGPMEVEWWYSRWQKQRNGVILPMQWDIRRVRRPYKRITVLGAAFDSVAVADSFVVSDSLRARFLATATKPMYDVPLDSARIVAGAFATLAGFGYPTAVKVGGKWVLVEAGQAALSAERAVEWLRTADPGAGVSAAIVTAPVAASGGAVWLASHGIPVRAAPGAVPFLAAMFRNHGRAVPANLAVNRGQWLRSGTDSLWVEPIDLPDGAGAVVIYSPTLKWAYSAMAALPAQADYVLARLKARGWEVTSLGSWRGITGPTGG